MQAPGPRLELLSASSQASMQLVLGQCPPLSSIQWKGMNYWCGGPAGSSDKARQTMPHEVQQPSSRLDWSAITKDSILVAENKCCLSAVPKTRTAATQPPGNSAQLILRRTKIAQLKALQIGSTNLHESRGSIVE